MAVTSQQIENRLGELKSLLAQIIGLRHQADGLQAELTTAEEDYRAAVGPANAERERLSGDKMTLIAKLTDRPQLSPPPPGGVQAPKDELKFEPRERIVAPPPREDPRYARKRALCDYIYDLLDASQEQVLRSIHAMQTDDRLDVCDMLEALPWGPIWEARRRSETLDDQYLRLGGWQEVLTERLGYWQDNVTRLQAEGERGLLREKRSRSPEAWQTYLAARAVEQQEENERLRHEVAVLNQQWQAKQAKADSHV